MRTEIQCRMMRSSAQRRCRCAFLAHAGVGVGFEGKGFSSEGMCFNLEDMSFSFECLGFSSEGLNFSTEALGTEGNEKHHTHCLFNHSRAIVLQYNDAHCLHHEAVGHRPREPGQSELPVAIHAAIHVCSHKGNSRSFPLRVNVLLP